MFNSSTRHQIILSILINIILFGLSNIKFRARQVLSCQGCPSYKRLEEGYNGEIMKNF